KNDVHHSSLIRWQKKEDAIRDGKGNSMTLHKGRRRFGHEQGHVQFILDQVENKIQLQEYCSVAYLAFALAHRDPSFLATSTRNTIRQDHDQENIPLPSHLSHVSPEDMPLEEESSFPECDAVAALGGLVVPLVGSERYEYQGEVLRKHSRICTIVRWCACEGQR
ncbi:hypothetical protein BC829DRAFT_408539, partial [Chytridium lagenaria]